MKIIDLTQTICENMPVFPGDEPPTIVCTANIEEYGFTEHRFTLGSHAGTHIDGPAHILPHSRTLDRLPLEFFIGPGSVIDLTTPVRPEISVDELRPHEDIFKQSKFILLYTGWSELWGQEQYYREFPVLSMEAALWVRSFGLKGLGVDTISVDPVDSREVPVHKVLLEKMILIENLTNLGTLPHTGFTFSCMPLKVENADASPVRAIAIL